MKKFEDLDLMDDFLNNVLANDDLINQEAYRTILETLLEIKISDIEIINQRSIVAARPDQRGIRLDVLIEEYDDNGTVARVFDYEPHRQNDTHFPKHNRFYQAKIDSKLMKAGDNDFSKMPELYVITITNFDLWGKGSMVYPFENHCQLYPDIQYGDGIHFIYFNTQGTENGSTSIKNMLSYIQSSRGENAVDEATRKINSYVEQLKDSEKVRDGYMTLGDRMDQMYADGVEAGKAEGIEQGKAEGIEQGKAEGRAEGMDLMGRLIVRLLSDGRNDDISRVATDAGYREKLYDEYGMKMNTND